MKLIFYIVHVMSTLIKYTIPQKLKHNHDDWHFKKKEQCTFSIQTTNVYTCMCMYKIEIFTDRKCPSC